MVQLVGRQTLAVFLAGLVLAQALGVVLDVTGRTFLTVAVANLGGCLVLFAVAAACEWLKNSPWLQPAPTRLDAGWREPFRIGSGRHRSRLPLDRRAR